MQRTFDELTTAGQIRRIRWLAVRALGAFGLSAKTPLTLLNHGENTTFRVAGTGRRKPRVLRVHRPSYQTPTRIRSEVMWLHALAADTDLTVPRPFEGADGQLVQIVEHPGVDGTRTCTLLSWVPGRFTVQPGSIAGHRRVGRLTARLHDHSSRWRRPRGFRRKAWDADGLVGPGACWGDPVAAPQLSRSQRRLIARTRERVLREMEAYGRGRDRYGLIHADLHPGNVLTQGDEARPIDFDDCGPGWHMYDYAVSLLPSAAHPRFERAKAAYVEGYRAVRPLADEHVDRFDLFAVARRLAMLGWVATRADNPRIGRWLRITLQRTESQCEQFLKTGRIR